jgi:hypothetical protein
VVKELIEGRSNRAPTSIDIVDEDEMRVIDGEVETGRLEVCEDGLAPDVITVKERVKGTPLRVLADLAGKMLRESDTAVGDAEEGDRLSFSERPELVG